MSSRLSLGSLPVKIRLGCITRLVDSHSGHVESALASKGGDVPLGLDADLALENLPSTSLPCRPLTSMQELRAFIADFPPEHVGLCLDTGHACICGLNPAEQARIASERLVALHLQDVDGEKDCHWIPGQGVINWSELGAALEAIQFNGARTFEITGGDETAGKAAENCHAVCERWQKEGIS